MRLFGRQRASQPAVEVSEKDGVRYLHLGGPAVQSAMRIKDPFGLELEYTRAMMMFLVLHDAPNEIALIGLGGGSVAKFVHRHLPECRLRAMEITQEVVDAARGYFLLPADDERLRVEVADGAARVLAAREDWDVLLVDGYDAHRIVEALASAAFYAAARRALKVGGLAVFNLWGSDRYFDTYLARIEHAFAQRTLILPAERRGNIQVFAHSGDRPLPDMKTLHTRAQAWDDRLGLGFDRFVDRLRDFNPTLSARAPR